MGSQPFASLRASFHPEPDSENGKLSDLLISSSIQSISLDAYLRSRVSPFAS
jgi:hypothetical protein